MKKLLLFNPKAGGRARAEGAERVCRLFAKEGWAVFPAPTRGPMTAGLVVREHEAEIDGVVVWGGDGTVNEALPALVGSHMFLAILPGGTANTLARELGAPRGTEAAVRRLAGGEARPVNVGMADSRPFLAMAGIGFDAWAAEHVSARLKRLLGRGAFFFAAVRGMREYAFQSAVFRSGGREWEAPFGVVSNSRFYGGGMVLSPGSDIRSPHLSLCLFQGRGVRAYLGYVAGVLTGSHARRGDVVCLEAAEVRVEGPPGIPYQVDGEPAGLLPVTIRSVPGKLSVLFPA